MTEPEILESLRQSFRSAEDIWHRSPFVRSSVWIGYAATEEESLYIFGIIGNQTRPITAKDPAHSRMVALLRNILPAAGADFFVTGYDRETIYVAPPPTIWTPTTWVCSMATDPRDNNRQYTVCTGICGAAV